MEKHTLLSLAFLALFSFSCGCLAVLQSTVNQRLGVVLIGTLATVLSFTVGWVCLSVFVTVEAACHGLPLLFSWKAPPHWSIFFAGPIGALFVQSSVYITLYIGFSLYYLFLVSGQLFAAILADHFGYGVKDNERLPLTPSRGLFLLLALAGVLLSVVEGVNGFSPANLGWALLSFLTGCATLVQSVLNRQHAALLPSKLQSMWWSFTVGLAFALGMFGIHALSLGPELQPTLARRVGDLQPVLFIGGILGCVFVFGAVYVPNLIGSQAYSVALVSGQLVCSALLDSYGVLGISQKVPSPPRVVGIVLVLFAAAGMQVPLTASQVWALLALLGNARRPPPRETGPASLRISEPIASEPEAAAI